MSIPVIDMYDTIGSNVNLLPAGQQVAGYSTGSGVVPWSELQFADHVIPHPAVRIDQDAGASDVTADMLDVETNAANLGEIVRWLGEARASFKAATRPGQRWPGIYVSLSNLNQAVAELTSAGITDVPFGIPDLTNHADATVKVSTASGNYYRVWQQYAFGSSYDSGIVSVPWLERVSKVSTPEPPSGSAGFTIPGIPGVWKAGSPVVISGLGPEGQELWLVITTDGKTFSQSQHVNL